MIVTDIFTRIIIFMREEDEPVFCGEISICLGIHWFVVKKALDMMIEGGMILFKEKRFSAEIYSISCPEFWDY